MDTWYWKTGWIPSFLAVAGNGLVIYVVITGNKLLTTTNRVLLSLAIADLCVGACFYPSHAICHFSSLSCNTKIREDISVLVVYASVMNLCAMTLDRYIAITKPLQYMSVMTVRRASLLAAVSWLIPLSIFFIPSLCASLNLFHLKLEISNITYTTLFEFIPCAFLLLATTRAVITARRHFRHDLLVESQLRFNQPGLKHTHSCTSVKVTATVVLIFLVCYTMEIYSSICYFTELCTLTRDLHYAVRFLIITNSAANPIVYAFLKQDIREELRNIFCGGRRKMKRGKKECTTQV